MSGLAIKMEWEPAPGVSHAALAATWARIEILVGTEPVTALRERQTAVSRTGVYGPAFLVAEWIVENFWFFMHECIPSPAADRAWLRRHALHTHREGTSLPDLRLFRDEDFVVLEWRPLDRPTLPVTFTGSGHARLPLADVRAQLSNAVDAVMEQIRGVDHADARALRADWEAIQAAAGDDARLCRRAASLGLDAFNLDEVDDEVASLLLDAAGRLPDVTRDDLLFAGVRPMHLARTIGAIAEDVTSRTELPPRVEKGRSHMRPHVPADLAPYQSGYAAAHWLREKLSQPVNGHVSLEKHIRELGMKIEEAHWTDTDPRVKGVVGFASGSPCLIAGKKREAQERFLVARALYAILSGSTVDAPRLLTSAGTRTQAASRAFAAELLAPAEALRGRMTGVPDEEWVDDRAEDFQVSSQVIEYQLENRLGLSVIRGTND